VAGPVASSGSAAVLYCVVLSGVTIEAEAAVVSAEVRSNRPIA